MENLTENSDFNELAEEDLLKRHRKEKKELQSKITSLKHALNNKNDKKTKKELQTKIAQEESEMESRHRTELQEFHRKNSAVTMATEPADDKDVTEDLTNLNVNTENGRVVNHLKISKAQKRREAKEQMAKDLETRLAGAEQDSANSERASERRSLDAILTDRRLRPVDIVADGDCMYNAISHQLSLIGSKFDQSELRRLTYDVIKKRKDEFLPFLSTVDENSDTKFDEYCEKILQNGVWGGEPELKALSIGLEKSIEIVQADGKSIIVGDHANSPPLIITYHKYAYNSGEHYNSTESL